MDYIGLELFGVLEFMYFFFLFDLGGNGSKLDSYF